MSQSSATRTELPGGLDRVLVSSASSSTRHMHRAHPHDRSRPACGRTLDDGNTWQEKTHWRHVICRPRCGTCPWPDESGGRWSCLDCPDTFESRTALREHQDGDCPGSHR